MQITDSTHQSTGTASSISTYIYMEEAKEEEASDPSSYVVWPGTCAHMLCWSKDTDKYEREREQSE